MGLRYAAAAASVLFLLIAVGYVQFYRGVSFGPIRQTTGLPEFYPVCDAARAHTAREDAILYSRARALSLYTGRPASSYNYRGRDAELWRWAEHIQAKYVVTTNAFDSCKTMRRISSSCTRTRTSSFIAFVRLARPVQICSSAHSPLFPASPPAA